MYGEQAVYKLVSNLFWDLEFDREDEYGTWVDIAIMDGVGAEKGGAEEPYSHV